MTLVVFHKSISFGNNEQLRLVNIQYLYGNIVLR